MSKNLKYIYKIHKLYQNASFQSKISDRCLLLVFKEPSKSPLTLFWISCMELSHKINPDLFNFNNNKTKFPYNIISTMRINCDVKSLVIFVHLQVQFVHPLAEISLG